METVLRIGLSNTLVALGLAALAAAAGRLHFRPALVHGLWVLVLVALVAPPPAVFPTAAGRAWSWARPAAPPRGPIVRDPPVPPGLRKPSGEYGEWIYWGNRDLSEIHHMSGAAASKARLAPGVEARLRQEEEDGMRQAAGTATRLMAAGRIADPPAPVRPASGRGPKRAGPADWGRALATRLTPTGQQLALAVWLGVAAVWWGRTAWRLRRFGRLLRWAAPAPDSVQVRAGELAHPLGLRSAPAVWFVPAPISPMLWGLGRRPRLLVPEDLWSRLGPEQQDALLVHELAHFRRRDHWVRLLEIAVSGLHWWNPLAWWARRALREVEERCCDAWVNSALPGRARAYALVIVETLDYLAGAPRPDPLDATGLTSAHRLKERLTRILAGATAQPLSWPGTAVLLGLAVAAVGMRPGLPAPRYYRAMDLGTLGGLWTTAWRINDRGEVIGQSRTADNPFVEEQGNFAYAPHAFRTAPNRPIDPATDDLSLLVGASEEFHDDAAARGINNAGQVIVRLTRWSRAAVRGKRVEHRSFLIEGRRVLPLGPDVMQAVAINDAGLIAAMTLRRRPEPERERPPRFRTLLPNEHGWDQVGLRVVPGRPVDPDGDGLGHLGGFSAGWLDQGWGGRFTEVTDLNASGQVVGTSAVPPTWEHKHAYRTAPGRPIDPATDDLGALAPSEMSMANAVNDLGQVVGMSMTGEVTKRHEIHLNAAGRMRAGTANEYPSRHAFRTGPNRPIDPTTDDLGTLGGPDSVAYAINNRGDVVGEAHTSDMQTHAFLHSEGRMIDLNTCVVLPDGWILERASGINDRGQIIADAVVRGPIERRRDPRYYWRRGFLLTPAPEPIPLAMLVVGAAVMTTGLALRRCRITLRKNAPGSQAGPIPTPADRA